MISAKVLRSEIDQNGNIQVFTEYTLTDGSKKTGKTRYSAFNYSREAIQKDIQAHCETLMKKVWSLKRNQEHLATKVDDLDYQCVSLEVVVKPAVYDKDGNLVTPEEKITINDQ